MALATAAWPRHVSRGTRPTGRQGPPGPTLTTPNRTIRSLASICVHPRASAVPLCPVSLQPLGCYRPWLLAAAVYNLAWGSLMVLAPGLLFRALGMPGPGSVLPWQLAEMFVLVYAPAYWWASRRPARHAHLVLIGLTGKILGPLGFVWAVFSGQLPATFGWTILTNDLIWWPAFALFLRDAAALASGWSSLLRGEGIDR